MKIKIIALLVTSIYLNNNASNQPKHKHSSSASAILFKAPATKSVLNSSQQADAKQEQEELITVSLVLPYENYENKPGKFNARYRITLDTCYKVSALIPYIHYYFSQDFNLSKFKLSTSKDSSDQTSIVTETMPIKNLPRIPEKPGRRRLFVHLQE